MLNEFFEGKTFSEQKRQQLPEMLCTWTKLEQVLPPLPLLFFSSLQIVSLDSFFHLRIFSTFTCSQCSFQQYDKSFLLQAPRFFFNGLDVYMSICSLDPASNFQYIYQYIGKYSKLCLLIVSLDFFRTIIIHVYVAENSIRLSLATLPSYFFRFLGLNGKNINKMYNMAEGNERQISSN